MSEDRNPRQTARQRLARLTRPSGAEPPAEPPAAAAPREPAPSAGSGGALGRLAGSVFDPGRPGLRALVAVVAVVALGAAALAWWSRPRPEPVLAQSATAAPAVAGPTAPAELVVAVSGEVHEPGLVELPPGARVADAIEAAGGLLPDADVDHLNLARKVVDGELIAVGIPPPAGAAGDPAAPGPGPVGPGPGGKVNLNTATIAELETLPGIGPAMAQRVVDYRTENGPFTSVEQLREVSGIGEVRFAELEDLVTV